MADYMDDSMKYVRQLDKSPAPENNFEENNIPDELRKDIEAVLNLFVRPKLQEHKGDMEVSYLDDKGTLWVELLGECSGCPSADDTAKGLIEKELVSRLPQIKAVEIDTGITYDIIESAMKLMGGR